MRVSSLLIVAPLAFSFVFVSPAEAGGNWGQWRGPEATGVSPDGNPPVEWSEEKNVRWRVNVPGVGSSSPIVWGDRVYIQTAIETDVVAKGAKKEQPAPPRRRRGPPRGPPPTNIHDFVVMALAREDGKVIWSRSVRKELPHEGHHRTGTFASNSPVTDGERLYAYFGSRGLYCLDMNGKVQWQKDLGRMNKILQFGEGSSPALHGDTLFVTQDHLGGSFIIALDKNTGEKRWKVDRDERSTWATPIIVEVNGKLQVITSGSNFSRGYDAETGKVLWKCSGLTRNPIPSPVHARGMVYLMTGFRGSALQAVRLREAKGDISGTKAIAWTHNKSTPYVPSPLLYGDSLYFLQVNRGALSCFDAESGKPNYGPERLEDIRGVYSSPVGASGRVYVTGREGTTLVLKHGSKFEVLAKNRLDDGFDASPAIAEDEIYLRGRENLYCIARPPE